MNRVYVCTDFAGHWPVGTSAVVLAPDESTARAMLTAELAAAGLSDQPNPLALRGLNHGESRAVILNSGDY